MAQRTYEFKVATGEISTDSELQFLASTKDSQELCYEYEPMLPSAQIDEAESQLESRPIDITSPPLLHEEAQDSAKASLPLAAPSIADVPLSAGDIVQALVARKLCKKMEQVSPSKSIKALSGGKSE
jgi:fatty acid synthase subunit alpha